MADDAPYVGLSARNRLVIRAVWRRRWSRVVDGRKVTRADLRTHRPRHDWHVAVEATLNVGAFDSDIDRTILRIRGDDLAEQEWRGAAVWILKRVASILKAGLDGLAHDNTAFGGAKMFKKHKEQPEAKEAQVIDITPNATEGSSTRKKRAPLIIGSTVLGILVLGGAGYVAYEYHQQSMMKSLDAAGLVAMSSGNYTAAKQDFTKALSYANSALVKAHLQQVDALLSSQADYQHGQQLFQQGQYLAAIGELQKVSSQDKQDYPQAQTMIREAKTEASIQAIMNDYKTFANDISKFISDDNATTSDINSMTSAPYDMSSEENSYQNFQVDGPDMDNDASNVAQDVSTLETDIQRAQMVANSQLSSVLTDLQNALSDLETNIGNLTALEQQIASYSEMQILYGFVSMPGQQWTTDNNIASSDITEIDNDIAKLKAYTTNVVQNQ